MEEEKRENRERYVQRQAGKYERLAKYSLDPENRQRYEARAEEWKERLKPPRTEPPEQLEVDGWNGEKPVAKLGESGILKEKDYTPKPITKESIDAVPKVKPSWWDDASAERLQAAQKELLTFVKDEPVGTEAAFVLAEDGTIVNRVMGEMGKVALPSPSDDRIVIHNHPSCGPLSYPDIDRFIGHDNLRGITAVGNDGSICGLFKGPDYDGFMLSRFFMSQKQEIEEAKKTGDAERYVNVINLILEEAKKNGAELIR